MFSENSKINPHNHELVFANFHKKIVQKFEYLFSSYFFGFIVVHCKLGFHEFKFMCVQNLSRCTLVARLYKIMNFENMPVRLCDIKNNLLFPL